MLNNYYIMQACWLTDVRSAISEATSQLASESDSISKTKDPFASVVKMKVNLRTTRSFLRMTAGFLYWTRLDGCISIYGHVHNVHVL